MNNKQSFLLTCVICLISIICCSNKSFAQNREIDSLKKLLSKNIHDTVKLEVLNQLVNISSENEFESYNIKLEALCSKLNHQKNKRINFLVTNYLMHVYDTKSYIFREKGSLDSSFFYSNKSLKISKNINDNEGISQGYRRLGLLLSEKGEVLKSIDYFQKGLLIAEKIKDLNMVANFYSDISVAQYNLDNNKEAVRYMFKSQNIFFKLNNKTMIADNYNTLGSIYSNMGKFDSSLYFHKKGYQLFIDASDTVMILRTLNNIGHTYYFNKQLDTALFYYMKAINIMRNKSYYSEYSTISNNIGEIYLKKKNLQLAKKFSEQALEFEKKINRLPVLKNIYSTLESVYFLEKQYLKAYEMLTKYTTIKDTLLGIDIQNASTKKFLQYEFEKKQLADSIKVAEEKKVTTAQLKQEKATRYTLFVGLVLVTLFGGFMYNRFKVTQKQKRIISEQKLIVETQKEIVDQKNLQLNQQNEEISAQRDEIEAQRDEITAQRDLVTEQKEHIEEIHKEVTDSINYAKRIQEAVLPVSGMARSVLGEHFILFKPKDVVSGDFYFATKINNWLIVAVADCTGHGVPGAFMSMLGISFLNEIVQKEEIRKANQILINLRKEIINALQQKGVVGEQKDGMDISLLVVNADTNECQWAGANNPLYIVRKFIKLESEKHDKNIFQLSNFQLDELKGDKMPIAIYPEMKDFTNYEFKANKGDCIYLFSDGFADQFGGPKARKFMYKQFKEILLQNSLKQMDEQKKMLENAFENWKCNAEQIDDVTVLGMRI